MYALFNAMTLAVGAQYVQTGQMFAPPQPQNAVKFNEKTVYQSDDFDPGFVDDKGRTNIERMQKGLAPIGYDGESINIHHIYQTDESPVLEITKSEHQTRYAELHTNTGQSPSQIDRDLFNDWRQAYWKWRATDFLQK
jgi:hypothetical protein